MRICSIIALFVVSALADEAPIKELIGKLDDEEFLVRQQATIDLIKTGDAAIEQLTAAAKDGPVEQRTRATEALRMIQKRRIGAAFKALGEREEKDIEVEIGMVLLAQVLDPQVTAKAVSAKLDEVAATVRKVAGAEVDVKKLPPAQALDLVIDVLKNDCGLEGDREAYDHPDNSSIHRAFEQKNGLPILLSEIAVAVGKRLDLPLVGVGVPGNYMFKYEGTGAAGDVLVDPYDEWQLKDRDLIAHRRKFDEEDLEAYKARATIERMMRNMESDFLEVGDQRLAADIRYYLSQFSRSAPAK